MTEISSPTLPSATDSGAGGNRTGMVAYGIALLIVIASAGLIWWTGWVEKLPIPWPDIVKVNEAFRNVNMPDDVGAPYRSLREGDDGYGFSEYQDGGDRIFPEDQVTTLGFGTPADHRRLPERRSNWYGARIYVNEDAMRGSPFSYWQLYVYYYTGIRDSVPHVGEICIRAGGGNILSAENVTFETPADLPEAWANSVTFRRIYADVVADDGSKKKWVEYYVFSVNGAPSTDRRWTRYALMSPLVRHCYFSKIQFSPLRGEPKDIAEADQAAQDFVTHVLPEVLKMLPMAETIDELDKAINSE